MKNKITKYIYQPTYILGLTVSILFIQCDCGGAELNTPGSNSNTPGYTPPNPPPGPTPITEDMIQSVKGTGGYLYPDANQAMKAMLRSLKDSPSSVNINEKRRELVENGTALHYATVMGDERIVRALLDRGALTNIQNNDHGLPLHYAVIEEHFEITKLLLAKIHPNDLEIKYAHGRTPLYLAAEKGNLSIFTLLINEGADICAQDSGGQTPLHIAAVNGYLEIVRYLVEKKSAQIDVADKYQRTPLYLAAKKNHLEVVRYLVGQGAKVDIDKEYVSGEKLSDFITNNEIRNLLKP